MRGRCAAAVAVLTLSARATADVGTDLRGVATRVAEAWLLAGAEVRRGESRFLMDDETITLDLRPSSEAPCRRVALVGSRGMSFHATAAADGEDGAFRVASVAGVLELSGCGAGVPDRVQVKSDSGRGALESVVAAAGTSLPPIRTILLERTGGALPAPPEPGPLPPLPLPAQRAALSETLLAREGFGVRPRETWTAGDDGKGSHVITLDTGCHRLDLFAVEPRTGVSGHRFRLDLDATLRREDGELLAEDQAPAPDVHLHTCVGVATRVTVAFEGSPRGSSVIATHGEREIPQHLPAAWGPAPRARFASAVLEHHIVAPPDDAIELAQGASGVTPVPLELEPGACYLAIAALEHGRGHAPGIHVTVGARRFDDDRGSKEDTATAAFCARQERSARVEVDARSAGSGWALAVFRMQGDAWDAGR